MRLLTFVVGNTHVKLGVYDGTRLIQHCRVQTNEERTADEYGVLVRNLLGEETTRLDGAAVASVVPTMTETMAELCRKYLHLEPLIVGPGVKTGMPILYDKAQDVGADRIVNAIAAYEITHDATIVVDFGTATVFDYLSARGEYVGGVICPGLIISSEALFARAAKLNPVELAKPKQVVGRNTVNAIQSGLVFGHAALVDGMVERIQRENKAKARVIATGGLSGLIAPETTVIEEVHEYLTLDGLRILYERNL
jgi:type III pantothenate kinase